ncbi:MAG: sulfur carrier protein ThiS [Thermoleophilia bacterium]|nr:sulfur carrier protein ThiS [Thermoleophilia bacterium]
MTIVVNGAAREVEEGDTVARLLERLELGGRWALVERNGRPVERAAYAETELADGDVLVIARPVAGG